MKIEKEKKEKLEQMIVAGLLMVFALILANSLKNMGFFGKKQPVGLVGEPMSGTIPEILKKASDKIALNTEAQEQTSSGSAKPAVSSSPVYEYLASDKRDPFEDFFSKPEDVGQDSGPIEQGEIGEADTIPPIPQLVLEGVIWGGARQQAIINGEVYDVGDMALGGTIKAIDKNGVTLDFAGYSITISESVSKEDVLR